MSSTNGQERSSSVPPFADTEFFSVVVVDDDAPLRRLVTHLLHTDGGFRVVGEADDGHHAIDVVTDAQPDIVLLDLNLPGLDGRAALPTIARAAPQSMITVLSAISADDEAATMFGVGAFAYLEKSVLRHGFADDVRELRRLFERGLEGRTVWLPDGPSRVRS